MNPFTSIGRVRSRLFRDPDFRRRGRTERAERAWRARESLRHVRQPTTVFPGPAGLRVWPQRVVTVALAVIGVFSIAAMSATRADAAARAPVARIHGCVVPGSGHDISLARNSRLQVADAVRWSDAYVGQAGRRRDNDGLTHNCG